MEQQSVVASKKRMVVAVCLDFLLFSVIWGIGVYLVVAEGKVPFWMGLAAFALVEGATYKLFGSPGMYMMSIDRSRFVDPDIFAREHWLTILLGVVFVLDGTMQLMRWTQAVVPEPFFGFLPDSGTNIAIGVVGGALSLAAGYLFLKLKPAGYWIGLALAIGMMVSCLVSWDLWQETAARIVDARRAVQGGQARPGEMEIMQTVIPVAILAYALGTMVAILCTRRNFGLSGNRAQPTREGGDKAA